MRGSWKNDSGRRFSTTNTVVETNFTIVSHASLLLQNFPTHPPLLLKRPNKKAGDDPLGGRRSYKDDFSLVSSHLALEEERVTNYLRQHTVGYGRTGTAMQLPSTPNQ